VTIQVDVTEAGDEPTDAVLREIERHEVRDAIVRIRVRMHQAQETMLRSRDIEDALADAHMLAGIAKEVLRETRNRIGLENPESLTPPQLLTHFFNSKNKPLQEIEELTQLAAEIMENNA
jgi:exonuclease SbcD